MKKFFAPDEINGVYAQRICDLDEGLSDSGVGGVLGDVVSGFQWGEVFEEECGSGRIDAEHRSLIRGNAAGNFQDLMGCCEGMVSPQASAVQENHMVVELELIAEGIADRYDSADGFVAWGSRESGFLSVGALGEVEVSGVDWGTQDFDKDLIRLWRRRGGFGSALKDLLRGTEVLEANDACK